MTHTNNGKQWELVQVPEWAKLVNIVDVKGYMLRLRSSHLTSLDWVQLLPANYGTPKLASELSESDWAEICKMMPDVGMYKNYMQPIDIFPLAKEAKLSGISLLASHNMTLTNCVIIPKI